MKISKVNFCFVVILLFSIVLTSQSFSLSSNPSQKEVSGYLKILDAKIAFNKAQGNVAKVKQLKAEKQRVLKIWKKAKASKNQKNTNKKLAKKGVTVKQKQSAVKKTASSVVQTPKVLSIEKQIKAVDKKISFYKKKKNTKMVKALQAKKAQLISSLKKQKGIESPKTDEVVKKSENKSVDIEGPIGTWLNNGHTSFRVIKTFFQNTDPRGQKAPQGTRFFVVDVEIKNADPFTAIYGGNYHKATLIDSNKVYYMEENAKNPDNWADNDSERELMPNESFETAYVFTIPEEAVPEKFIFDVSSADKYPVMKVLLK